MNYWHSFTAILSAAIMLSSCTKIKSPSSGAENTTIKIATEASYPPFEYYDADGQMTGFEVELAKEVCQIEKLKCEFLNQPFDSLIPGMMFGKFDIVMGAINITEERLKKIDFSKLIFANTAKIVTNKAQPFKEQDLKNKTIAVQSGTSFDSYLKTTYGDGVTIKSYESYQLAFLDLKNQRIDAIMGDAPALNAIASKFDKDSFHTVVEGVRDERYFGIGNAFAFKKGNNLLKEKIDAGLTKLETSGRLAELQKKYLGI